MAFSVTEYVTSRRTFLAKDTESAVLEFVGYGDSDDAVARAAFDALIPATFTQFVNPLARLDFECYTLGGLFWRASARYGPDPAPAYPAVGVLGAPTPVAAAPGLNTPLGPEYAFDFSGVVEHITQSKATTSKTKRATKTGTLTTRTDDDTGTFTMTTGHGFVTADVIDVYWSGGFRRGMTATVTGDSVVLDGGTGTVLPAATTAVTAIKAADASAAPDNKGAIGVTADGQVQGCDRLRPNLEWSKTVTFASVAMDYINSISALVGSTNNATFHTKPAGSVIFTGGNCQIDDSFKAKVTFKFLDSPNLTDVTICDGLVVPAKKGSEYLWVSYKDAKDGGRVWQQPDGAYVERIVDSVDFAALRIGV